MSSHDEAGRVRPGARVGLIAGIAGTVALMIAIVVLYPLDLLRNGEEVAGIAAGLVMLASLGVWVAARGFPTEDSEAARASRRGAAAGLVFGALWVVEIGYNNFIAPPISVRDPVDNVIWAAIAVGMLAVSTMSALRARAIAAGARAGVWSGLVSGLVACLMALLLVVFGMRFLLADAVNRAEWVARGTTSGLPNMAAYEAYQTLAGALLHLVLLGIVMGALLGGLGGLLGKVIGGLASAGRRAAL